MTKKSRLRTFWESIKPSEAHPFLAKRVKFSYNDNEVLKGLDITVKNSQIIAVVGKSGSGKTTFLKIASGVLTGKHKGSIRILGNNKALAKDDLGYVPQELAIIPDLSIEENFEFFGKLNGIKKDKAISAGNALMSTLQLNIPTTRKPTELSGGQKVRLNIICSILHDPKVIILDEPFVGLDYYNRKLLWHFLEHQKNRRKTIILTTHLLTEAEHHSNRLILLHKGKIFARGKMEDIRKKLKSRFILELKFINLTKTAQKAIEAYCNSHDVKVMDLFNNYMMVSVMGEGQKNYFYKFLNKHRLDYYELGFREPNLDELFLKVRSV